MQRLPHAPAGLQQLRQSLMIFAILTWDVCRWTAPPDHLATADESPLRPHGVCSDIGCHIDGYIAQAAHSLVVAADAAAPVTGRAADVMQVRCGCSTAWEHSMGAQCVLQQVVGGEC